MHTLVGGMLMDFIIEAKDNTNVRGCCLSPKSGPARVPRTLETDAVVHHAGSSYQGDLDEDDAQC